VAIDETARIKDKRAMRRHIKRIANCLARENTEPLQTLVDAREEKARAAARCTTRWSAGASGSSRRAMRALTEFLDDHPDADRQELRTLMRSAQRDAARGKPDAPTQAVPTPA
jgi:ribosome-associated protein